MTEAQKGRYQASEAVLDRLVAQQDELDALRETKRHLIAAIHDRDAVIAHLMRRPSHSDLIGRDPEAGFDALLREIGITPQHPKGVQ